MTSQGRKHRGGLRLPPARERIMNKVQHSESGCWEIHSSLGRNGYAQIKVNGKSTYVHRVMFEEFHGAIPDGMFVCHRCDNRKCCNPEHLFLGSATDNNRDMFTKGRGVKVKPPEWRKITLDNLPGIIDRFQGGESKSSIALDFDVTRQAIHYLLKREGAL